MTTIDEINNSLSIMDKSLAKLLATGNVNDIYDYNINREKLHTAIYGNYYGCKAEVKPTFTGHLHVKPEYEYLLSSLKHN